MHSLVSRAPDYQVQASHMLATLGACAQYCRQIHFVDTVKLRVLAQSNERSNVYAHVRNPVTIMPPCFHVFSLVEPYL